MNLLTHFKKTKTVRNIFLSLGAIFALAITAHAQNLYVSVSGAVCGFNCSEFSGSISEYTPDGIQMTIVSGLARPRGLAFDSSGNLFAAINRHAPPIPQFHGRILKFPPLGHQSVLGNIALSFLEAVVTDSGGNIFAMAQSESSNTTNTIYKFAPDGTRTVFGTIPGAGFDLAFDSAGNLYATDPDDQTIYKFTPDGTRSVFAGPSEFAEGEYPVGLAFDSSGNLFVSIETFTDPGADSIVYFTPTGVKSTFATGLTFPRGLAFDSSDNLFVAEDNPAPDGDILKFAPEGGAPIVFASGIDLPEFLAFGPPR
jgi:DNA-binding beta-propeller fold protein YncE